MSFSRIHYFILRDIHNYCIEDRMRLNPKKCKEIVVNFMGNPNTVMRPLYIGNQIVESILSYKFLGVIINENLKWNCNNSKGIKETLRPQTIKASWRARTRHVESL